MGKIFPEILNLCEVRKFYNDPASRSENWDQVNKILSQFKEIFEIDRFFEIERIFSSLGPSLRTWKLGHREIFSLHTNLGFQEKFYPWGVP